VTASAHERYRSELELLATDEPILRALELDEGWRRTYARFFPDEDPFAVLTLERAGRMLRVDVFHGPRFTATDAADDIPGLRAVLAAGAEIVRYHPGVRCTVRHGERFGKVGAAPELDAKQRLVWQHRHELGFAVAEPLGYDEATRTLWLGAVPGDPAPLDAGLAERMGAALATLARARLRPPPRAPARPCAPRSRHCATTSRPARRGRSTAPRTRRSGSSAATGWA
jgi:hypothetical protein